MKTRLRKSPGVVIGDWWHQLEDGRIQCDLCPRHCKLHEGQHGFCFIRMAEDSKILLTSYGRASGFQIDPIEKKPLNHFLPGTSVLSFGTAGCNLGCKFCQNWNISKARYVERLSSWAEPEDIALAARKHGSKSIAFTYNDPVIFAEYAIDAAIAAHEQGLRTVAVTAGYITKMARSDFFEHMDAANVDLKAFTNTFYQKLCFANIAPVLETLLWLKQSTSVWLEITTLLIPGQNDSVSEVASLVEWIAENLGPFVPLHFTAFHPDFKLINIPSTPHATLFRARDQAIQAGLKYVYTGNISHPEGNSTYCHRCGTQIIERRGYQIKKLKFHNGCCANCGQSIPGVFNTELSNLPTAECD